jgi:Tol biopolymer transport system component
VREQEPIRKRTWRVLALLSPLVLALVVMAIFTAVGDTIPADGSRHGNGPITFVRSSGRAADIMIVDPGDGDVRPLVAGDGTRSTPAWSTDGLRLAFTERGAIGGGFHIHVLDASGPQQLTEGPWIDGSPAWSPDGSRIAFASNRGGQGFGIFVMDADGSGLVRVADGQTPCWSPDGSRIAFVRSVGGRFDVLTMAPDGRDVREVTDHAADDRDPSWAPDGRLVFASDREGSFDLYVAGADGGSVRRLTRGSHDDRDPSWAPDGSAIVFSRWTERSADLWIIGVEGKDARRLTSDPLFDIAPAWQPAGPRG